jgi:hypothetical protein
MEALVSLSRSTFSRFVKTCAALGGIAVLGTVASHSAATTDSTFNVSGSGPSGVVYATAVRPDGKIVIGGYFTYVNGTSRPCLAVLNSNGTLDTSFSFSINGTVYAIAVQSDNSIIIGGDFTTVNSNSRSHFARFSSNGTLDSLQVTNLDSTVYAVDIAPSGDILVGGAFSLPHSGLIRVTSGGVVDYPATDYATVYSIAINKNSLSTEYGNIYVGGNFTAGYTARLAKLGSDLSVAGWNASVGSGTVYAIALQNVGGTDMVLIGGSFGVNGNITTSRLSRIGADVGGADSSFNTYLATPNNEIRCILPWSDGRVYVGGYQTTGGTIAFTCYEGNGTIDSNHQAGYGATIPYGNGTVYCIAQQSTKILAGGYFNYFYPSSHNMFERIIP